MSECVDCDYQLAGFCAKYTAFYPAEKLNKEGKCPLEVKE